MKYAKALPVHGRALRRLAENAGVTGFDEAAVQTPPSRSLATVHWTAAWEWVRIFESILYGKRQELRTIPAFGRSGGIRTRGLLDPNQARYQASPHPVSFAIVSKKEAPVKGAVLFLKK